MKALIATAAMLLAPALVLAQGPAATDAKPASKAAAKPAAAKAKAKSGSKTAAPKKAATVAKAETTTALMERVRRSILLGELTRLRPKNVNFASLELKSKEIQPPQGGNPNSDLERARRQQEGLPAEAVKPAVLDVSLDLFATAPTDAEVAAYMSALQKSPLLADVNLLFSEEYRPAREDKTADAVRKFHVEMKINPAADLRGSGAVADALPK